MLSEKVPADGEGGSGGLKAKLAARFKKRYEDSPEKKVRRQCMYCCIARCKRAFDVG